MYRFATAPVNSEIAANSPAVTHPEFQLPGGLAATADAVVRRRQPAGPVQRQQADARRIIRDEARRDLRDHRRPVRCSRNGSAPSLSRRGVAQTPGGQNTDSDGDTPPARPAWGKSEILSPESADNVFASNARQSPDLRRFPAAGRNQDYLSLSTPSLPPHRRGAQRRSSITQTDRLSEPWQE